MNILVNGEKLEIAENSNITDLIDLLALGQKRIAIECNTNIIAKSKHHETILNKDDKIEVIHAVGGG